MEALCNPMTSVQPSETVNLCLKALSTLLDDPWTRLRLGADSSLTIELLNVLHRSCDLYTASISSLFSNLCMFILGDVIAGVCVFVCLSVCQQNYLKSLSSDSH